MLEQGILKVRTPEYNTNFNTRTGYFERWGTSFDDDPTYSPIGPELADIEISTKCYNNCPHCYKDNTEVGENMTLETFKKVLKSLPKSVTQIAFGIGSIDSNPDMFKIFKECRKHGIVPNVTISGNDVYVKSEFDQLAKLCGAIAVSNYDTGKYQWCYGKIEELTQYYKHPQINIHQLLSKETFDQCLKVAKDSLVNPKLSKLNAIVFLSLKQIGRGKGYNPVTDEQFKELIQFCLGNGVRFGFDSCTANKFLKCVQGLNIDEQFLKSLTTYIEPCESGLFSIYVNVKGEVYPCSFVECLENYGDLTITKDFLQDVWFSGKMKLWREQLLNNCRDCPV